MGPYLGNVKAIVDAICREWDPRESEYGGEVVERRDGGGGDPRGDLARPPGEPHDTVPPFPERGLGAGAPAAVGLLPLAQIRPRAPAQVALDLPRPATTSNHRLSDFNVATGRLLICTSSETMWSL